MGDKKTARRTKTAAYMLIGVGLIGLVMVVVLWQRPQPLQPPGTHQSAPSAVKPTRRSIDGYTVSPDLPRYIAIPAIKVPISRVMQLGLTKNNQIAAPANIYDAGWYSGSAKPGRSGVMFIYGHVSSWQANGIFYNLKKLRPGDTVTVTRGDGKTFTYRVVSAKTYQHDKVDMHAVLSPAVAGTPGLNLMTCAGRVIKGTSEFSERLVVFTKQVSAG